MRSYEHAFLLPVMAMCIILLTAGCMTGGDESEQDVQEFIQENDTLPAINLMMNDGTTVSADSLRKKPSMTVLFTTSCNDCRRLLPEVDRFYREYSEKFGISVICIARQEPREQTAKFWEEENMRMLYSPQEDRWVYGHFATAGVPRVYVADRKGVVRKMFRDSNPPTLHQMIDAAAEVCEYTDSLN